jgi:hypothetical protein
MRSAKIKVPKPHLSFASSASVAYSSEQALENTYNPREVVLSSKEVSEMKVFIDQSVSKLVMEIKDDGYCGNKVGNNFLCKESRFITFVVRSGL